MLHKESTRDYQHDLASVGKQVLMIVIWLVAGGATMLSDTYILLSMIYFLAGLMLSFFMDVFLLAEFAVIGTGTLFAVGIHSWQNVTHEYGKLLYPISVMAFAIGMLLLIHFVYQMKRYQNEVHEKQKETVRVRQMEQAFLSALSHEIRTPLNTIQGIADLLLSEDLPEKDQACIRQIKASGKQLLTMANSIVDYTNMETNKLHLVEVNYHMADLMEEIQLIIRTYPKKNGVRILLEADPGLPKVCRGDTYRIKQIIALLLDYAVKSTERGEVKVCCQRECCGGVFQLKISVKDAGEGISQNAIPKLFDLKIQTNQSEKQESDESGLGLVLSKKMVTLMNGKIDVVSEYGIGSEFIVSIPQEVIQLEPYTQKNARPVSEEYYNATVLVVDDNVVNRTVEMSILSKLQLKVDVAESGLQALEMVKHKQYDMIFMDYMMPEMDGIETAKRIRELGDFYFRTVPIIALTASAAIEHTNAFLQAGMNGYTTKPLDATAVQKILSTWLRGNEIPRQISGGR